MAKRPESKRKSTKKVNKKIFNELIKKGRKQGYLTYDEINEHLPDDLLSSEQIDETLMMFDDLDIDILTEEKRKIVPKETKPKKESKPRLSDAVGMSEFGTVTDPVKMYLREMGLVTLLSREGEIVIAKKIEAGEQEVLKALLETKVGVENILALGQQIENSTLRPKHVLRDVPVHGRRVLQCLLPIAGPDEHAGDARSGGDPSNGQINQRPARLVGDLLQLLHARMNVRPDIAAEVGPRAALVVFWKIGCVRPEPAGQSPARDRAVADQCDVVLKTIGDQLALVVTPHEVVAELVGVDRARLADLLHLRDGEVADADCADLACAARFFERFHGRPQVHIRARPVDVVQFDVIGAESLQRSVDRVKVLVLVARRGLLGCQKDAVALALNEFPDDGLAASVAGRRIEMIDPRLKGGFHHRHRVGVILLSQLHTPELPAAQRQPTMRHRDRRNPHRADRIAL